MSATPLDSLHEFVFSHLNSFPRSPCVAALPKQVMISYSKKDLAIGVSACARLEAAGLRCWFAPRDIVPGQEWGAAIMHAISSAKVMVLIYSAHPNQSNHVRREVERAVARGLHIIPFRIEDVPMSPTLEYFISTPHWFDALKRPLNRHLDRLAGNIASFLGEHEGNKPARYTTARPHPASIPVVVAPDRDEKQACPVRLVAGTHGDLSHHPAVFGLPLRLTAEPTVGMMTSFRELPDPADVLQTELRTVDKCEPAQLRTPFVSADATSATPTEKRLPRFASTCSPLILVADPDPEVSEMLVRLLRESGYVTESVLPVAGLVARLRHCPPALLLLEPGPPAGEGVRLLAALHADPEQTSIPVVCYAEELSTEVHWEAARLGVRAFLFKTRDSFPQLKAAIDRCVASRSAE